MLKHLSAKQAADVHSLAKKHCCNCDDGICLLMETPCAQIHSSKIVCRYFAEAVLPADANLNHEICQNETEDLLQ